jgi:hypothetical protein
VIRAIISFRLISVLRLAAMASKNNGLMAFDGRRRC